jgi:hypothetical protein
LFYLVPLFKQKQVLPFGFHQVEILRLLLYPFEIIIIKKSHSLFNQIRIIK